MKKIYFILPILLIITGCSSKINIDIDQNSVIETVELQNLESETYSKLKTWNGFPLQLYHDEELNDPAWLPNREKESGVKYYDITFNDSNNSLLGTGIFTIDEHHRSSLIRRCFKYYDVRKAGQITSFETGHGLICAFQNFSVTVSTPYKVINSNAHKIDEENNTYTWNITKENKNDVYISLKIDFSKKYKEEEQVVPQTPTENIENQEQNNSVNNILTTKNIIIITSILMLIAMSVIIIILKSKYNNTSKL